MNIEKTIWPGASEQPGTQEFWKSGFGGVIFIAALNLILHLVAIHGFGYFRDELYYIACSDHLAFGYVDQPPLSILLLKLVRLVFGSSLAAIRILPAFGSAVFIILTGLMAREIGGKRFALLLASVAAFSTTGNLFLFHFYSMNFLDILFWQVSILILLRIVRTGRQKLWIIFGIVAGLAFENKISAIFLLFGTAVGILLTKNRRVFKIAYLWLGAGLAVLLFLPYIVWNAAHGWPAIEFMRNAALFKNIQNTPLGFLRDQVFYNNPLTVFIWLPGLAYFFFDKTGRKYRLFGWVYLSLFVLFMPQHGKDYYLAATYPVLFAGGAVLLEAWKTPAHKRWPRPVAVAVLLVVSIILAPMSLPILSVQDSLDYYRASGIKRSQENQELGPFPQHFADEFGWEEMVDAFAGIYRHLGPADQSHCLIFVRNYGEAAAIDFFGKKYSLLKASCTHNSYWFWGPPEWSGQVAIVLGESKDVGRSLDDLRSHFEEVTLAGKMSCDYAMPYENGRPIFLCRGFKHSIREVWASEKHFN
jgi:hypothetical protein